MANYKRYPQERRNYWPWVIFALAAGVVSFMAGQDKALDAADVASTQDRLRVHCIDNPMDAMCIGIKN